MIFLGAPGSGKGTQAEMVAKDLGVPLVSTGDIMREEVKEGTELGKEVKSYMDSGELVPDDLVIDIIKNRINEDDCRKGFILDGFPRTVRQAEELEGITHVDLVLNLDAPHGVIIQRMFGRFLVLGFSISAIPFQ